MIYEKITFFVSGLLCLFNIIILPVNKYEWILQEYPKMALPVDTDQFFYMLLSFIPIIGLFLFFIFNKNLHNKISAFTIAILVFVWAYKWIWA